MSAYSTTGATTRSISCDTRPQESFAVLIIAFILSAGCSSSVLSAFRQARQPSGSAIQFRSQQFRTLSGVTYSIGILVITFIAGMQILALLGINMGPLLASAGVAGLAIGFGAQTLVKDFINGFFILAENQYDIGDTVRSRVSREWLKT